VGGKGGGGGRRGSNLGTCVHGQKKGLRQKKLDGKKVKEARSIYTEKKEVFPYGGATRGMKKGNQEVTCRERRGR